MGKQAPRITTVVTSLAHVETNGLHNTGKIWTHVNITTGFETTRKNV
jgi:hypothetical protein